MSGYNETLNTAIDRLHEALEDARVMPGWAVTVIVLVSLLTAIILIHVMALLVLSPCLYGLWKNRRDQTVAALLEVDEGIDDNEILGPPVDDLDGKT